jgi:hypothetical protein
MYVVMANKSRDFGTCEKCNVSLIKDAKHPYPWCSKCGKFYLPQKKPSAINMDIPKDITKNRSRKREKNRPTTGVFNFDQINKDGVSKMYRGGSCSSK